MACCEHIDGPHQPRRSVGSLALLAALHEAEWFGMASSPGAVVRPPFPLDASASATLAAALVEAIRRHDRRLLQLRNALCACVWSLRDQQMTAENTVITMKALLRHTAAHDNMNNTGQLAAIDHWMDDLVTWCIEDYFAET
jgi:hypothetical protein